MPDDIRDIHGPILHHAHAWWPYVLVAAGVVLAALIVLRLTRKKELPPSMRAMQALDDARDERDAERFSTRVSAAIRTYVEEAFDVHAPRRTTEELLSDLMFDGSPVARQRQELGTFLEQCDLAKYARWQLSDEQREAMLSAAEAFVLATITPPAGGAS